MLQLRENILIKWSFISTKPHCQEKRTIRRVLDIYNYYVISRLYNSNVLKYQMTSTSFLLNFCCLPIWSKGTRINILPFKKVFKNGQKYMKQWFSRHWTSDIEGQNPWEIGNKWGEPYNCQSFMSRENFRQKTKKKGRLTNPGDLFEWGYGAESLRRARWL